MFAIGLLAMVSNMRIIHNASLAQKTAAVTLTGLATLAISLLALYQYTLSSYADRQAEQGSPWQSMAPGIFCTAKATNLVSPTAR